MTTECCACARARRGIHLLRPASGWGSGSAAGVGGGELLGEGELQAASSLLQHS